MPVDGAGHELLAGAGLAGDEDGGVGRAGEGDLLVDAEHGSAAADEAVWGRPPRRERGRPGLAGAGPPRERAGDYLAHLADVHRLAHVVERPGLHRLERRLQRPERADQHHLDFRVARLERPQQVEAALLGVQVDVGENEVEAPAREERERVSRGLRHLDLAVRLSQQLVHEAAGLAVVVHDEDARHQSPLRGWRQPHDGGRALARPALEAHRAAVGLDDLAQDGQAEAGALARRLGREEGLEDPRELVGRDSGPRVRDDERHAVPVRPRRERQAAALGHRVHRVADQVEQRLLELDPVCSHGRKAGGDLDAEVDPPAHQRGAHELGEPLQELAGRERAEGERRPPRLVEQRLHDRGDPGDLLLDGAEPLRRRGSRPPASPGASARSRRSR